MRKNLLNIKHVQKDWGYEKWIVNKPEYCGKLLKLNSGKYTSWHFHKLKDEVMFLHSGRIKILSAWSDSIQGAKETTLFPGQAFHVTRGLRHRIIALDTSELFEFSTQHFDYDSYRIHTGDIIND